MASAADPASIDLFEFAVLRDPKEVPADAAARDFIADDQLVMEAGTTRRVATILGSSQSPSEPARIVFEWVFCGPENGDDQLAGLTAALLASLPRYAPDCWSRDKEDLTRDLRLEDLERHGFVVDGDRWVTLPDRLERLPLLPFAQHLEMALPILRDAQDDFELPALHGELEAIFDVPLYEAVFDVGSHSEGFANTKRGLFDALYLLYVVRQRTDVNLLPIMDALRALHALEALAIDQALGVVLQGGSVPSDAELLAGGLSGVFPALKGWDRVSLPKGLPLVGDGPDLRARLAATPIVHPIFGRLFHFRRPFNDIRPIGIADLKVVKQWLIGYEPGEISDVNNIMKGEARIRQHRRFEKSEDVFTYGSERVEETTHDNQSTERFEVKRETDRLLKTDLNVNAGLTLQYNGSPVIVTATGGFAYTRSQTDQEKASRNFSREVVSRAVSRVQSRVTEQRTATRIFEQEERNRHTFDNVGGGKHVSGIYRWIDKRYRAQLFNFGKRLMYEFVIPEPAAFLVESRLQAFTGNLDLPRKPADPVFEKVEMDTPPEAITEEVFNKWRTIYDLQGFEYPEAQRAVTLIGQGSGGARFTETDVPKAAGDRDMGHVVSAPCQIERGDGYSITELRLVGDLHFHDVASGRTRSANALAAGIDGTVSTVVENEQTFYIGVNHTVPIVPAHRLRDDSALLVLFLRDIRDYSLSVIATLSYTGLYDWQLSVYNAVKSQKQRVVDERNQEIQVAYDAAMTEYRNRLAEAQATVVNDVLQVQSERINQETIRTELKRHCLSMLTKEFDDVPADDILADVAAMETRNVPKSLFPRLAIDESSSPVSARYERSERDLHYPAIDLAKARSKGLTVQFLEQSFEWRQLSYVLYPYFWAPPPRWIEMMDRADDGDPTMTAFLRAGAARVVLAVAEDHDDAVQHYLCTRKPWSGNRNAPVLADPLHIPIYHEIRGAQDDRLGAEPEGEAWEFTVPTSLVYLEDSTTPLPQLERGRG